MSELDFGSKSDLNVFCIPLYLFAFICVSLFILYFICNIFLNYSKIGARNEIWVGTQTELGSQRVNKCIFVLYKPPLLPTLTVILPHYKNMSVFAFDILPLNGMHHFQSENYIQYLHPVLWLSLSIISMLSTQVPPNICIWTWTVILKPFHMKDR